METAQSRQQNVLYIEDTPDHLVLIQSALESKLGVVCDVATTSAGAQLKLNERCYDLIIADYNIPGEMGDVVADKVLERDKDQPFLMITEYMTQGIRAYCEERNIPLMGKFSTVEVSAFVETVRQLLAENYCDKKRIKPAHSIVIMSPHVSEAHDSLLREKAAEYDGVAVLSEVAEKLELLTEKVDASAAAAAQVAAQVAAELTGARDRADKADTTNHGAAADAAVKSPRKK